MSSGNQVSLDCPNCRETQDVQVWASVNVTVDPQLKEPLFDRTLNSISCVCGHTTEVAHDLLYHDMDLRFQVWLRYPEPDGTITLAAPILEAAQTIMDDYTFRVVRSRNQLIEKIQIFDDGLDDRVIELLKFMIWRAMPRRDDYRRDLLLYAGTEWGERQPKSLDFVLMLESGGMIPCRVGYVEGYAALERQLLSAAPIQIQRQGQWELVDTAFGEALAKAVFSI